MQRIFMGLAAAWIVFAGTSGGDELNSKGVEAYRQGRYQEAEAFYRQAIDAFAPDQRVARALSRENLGIALRAQGRGAEAREMLEQAVSELREAAGSDSAQLAQATNNLAGAYLTEQRYADAVRLLSGSLDSGDDRTRATSYGNLAVASIGLGEMAQAETHARRSLEFAERALPPDHPDRAVLLNNAAQACRFNAKYLEAEQYYRDALAIWEKALGPSHPDVGRGLMNLAAFYHERGREAGAEQLYLRAASILEKADPTLALVARNQLADVMRTQARYTEAEKLARATLRLLQAALPGNDPRVVQASANWAKLLAETKRSEEAAKVMTAVESAH